MRPTIPGGSPLLKCLLASQLFGDLEEEKEEKKKTDVRYVNSTTCFSSKERTP